MNFQPGLQSHFPNQPIEQHFLAEVRPRTFWYRMDAQKAERELSLEIHDDIRLVGGQPLVTCWSGAEAAWFTPTHVEYQNERSIWLGQTPPLPGHIYRNNWERDFWPAVQAGNHIGYFGAAANFEDRDLDWYVDADAGSLPPQVRCSIHDYWTKGESALQKRLDRWRDIIGRDRDYIVSECGCNSKSHSEIAAWMRKKWAFWKPQPHCLGLIYFQIFDDPLNDVYFGLYAGNPAYGWPILKQTVFDTFPLATMEVPDMSAASQTPLFVFDHAAVIDNADGTKSLRWNKAERRTDAGSNRVFSLQPDGSWDDRPDTAIDIWEKGKVEGDRLVFRTEKARAVFAWQS